MSSRKWTSAVGKPGRVIAARIERGEDAIESIIALIRENDFHSGTVTGIGSLLSATVVWGRSTDLTRPIEEIIVRYTMEGPVDLGIGWGMFGREENGDVFLHFHANIMDKEGNMRCGNLLPGSAPVMATLDITIQEVLDLKIIAKKHPILKHNLLNPMTV